MDIDTRQNVAGAKIEKKRFLVNRSFALLWIGQTISELGSHITGSGVPIAAILLLGATPMQVGLLTALGMVAYMVGRRFGVQEQY